MKVQAKEETGHGDKFFDYLVDQGARVILKPIAQVPTEFKSLLEVFEKALEHEKKMTGWLNQLYAQAVKESDYATQILLQWYITEQVEEEKNAGQIVEQLKIVVSTAPRSSCWTTTWPPQVGGRLRRERVQLTRPIRT